MKITINAGKSLEKALETVTEYLTENYSDYPITKNKTSIYVTLKNKEGQICPDNEKEFIIDSNGTVIDVFQKERERAYQEIESAWYNYYYTYYGNVKCLEHVLQTDTNYLKTAQERNRKPENVDRRKEEYERHLKALEQAKEKLKFVEILNSAVKSKEYKVCYTKYTSKSAYNYRIEVMLIFDTLEEFTGYFDKHGLHSGLPKGM